MDTTDHTISEADQHLGWTHGITRKRLIDSLNYANFQNHPITVNLDHLQYGKGLSMQAFPQPCTDEVLSCTWVDTCPANIEKNYKVRNFLVDCGYGALVVEPEVLSITTQEHKPPAASRVPGLASAENVQAYPERHCG